MALTDAAGNILTKAQLLAKTTDVTYPADKKFTETIFETFTYRGSADFDGGKRQKFWNGQVVTAASIDALYSSATVTGISPTTAAVAGGTVVTVTGTGFSGATGVNFGGAAGTNFKRVSATKITVTAPARTAGSQTVVVLDDGGNVSGPNITYA